MKKIFGLSVLLTILTLPSFTFASQETCSLPRKTVYNLNYQGIGFFSNLVIGLFGKSIFEDSKTFTIEEGSPCQNQKELKIANLKKVLLLASQNETGFSGTTNFKEPTPLPQETAKNLLALRDFVESDLKAGDGFEMSFSLNGKKYLAQLSIAKTENCPAENDCQISDVSVLIINSVGDKIISIEARAEKNKTSAGIIDNIKLKTLFWPEIIVNIKKQN